MGKWRDAYYSHAVRNTCCHNVTCWMIILFMTGVVNLVYPPLYPGDGSQVEFVDPYAVAKINFDGRKYAQQQYQAADVAAAVTEESAFIFVYDTADGGDIFTPQNLLRMCQMEQFLFEEALLPPSCDTETDNKTCVHNRLSGFPSGGTSITSIFYAFNGSDPATDWNPIGFPPLPHVGNTPLGQLGFNASDCYLLPEADVNAVKAKIFTAIGSSPQLRQLFGFFLNINSETQGFSKSTRSTLSFSVPVDDADSVSKLAVRVQDKMFDFLDMKPGFQRSPYRDNAQVDNVKVQFFEISLIASEFGSIIQTDFFMVFGSMTFVFFWMWVYTRSIIGKRAFFV